MHLTDLPGLERKKQQGRFFVPSWRSSSVRGIPLKFSNQKIMHAILQRIIVSGFHKFFLIIL